MAVFHEFWIVCSCIMLHTQKSHMTYIFICSSLKLLYIGFGYECFFLWKGQTLHMYHQCRALLIKKQASKYAKVIKIVPMLWEETWQFSERKMASKLSQRDGEASVLWLLSTFLLAEATCSCQPTLTEPDWGPPTLSSLLRVGAQSCPYHRDTKLTPPPHLKPPWNIWGWGWGRYLGQIAANPNWGFRWYTVSRSHPLATAATPERAELLLLSQKFAGSNTSLIGAAPSG